MPRESQNRWIQQHAPPSQVPGALASLGRSGLDALTSFIREGQATRRLEMESNASVRRTEIQASYGTQQAEIEAEEERQRMRAEQRAAEARRAAAQPPPAPAPLNVLPQPTPSAPSGVDDFLTKHRDTLVNVGAAAGVAVLLLFVFAEPSPR